MKELNDLVELAKKALSPKDAFAGVDATFEWRAKANPTAILAIAEAFRALEKRALKAEGQLEVDGDMVLDVQESMREWRLRAEAAEALNNHLELAVRKSEGVSESLRRRAEDAENKLLFTRPAPAVSLAELVPDEMTFDKAVWECREKTGVIARSFQVGFNACLAEILRNNEEAK